MAPGRQALRQCDWILDWQLDTGNFACHFPLGASVAPTDIVRPLGPSNGDMLGLGSSGQVDMSKSTQ